ncbi:hypothetical protein [uncultured Acinetobacter sp.]|nr:hypothetical protein [uncultured Acinetobacter sp.]
MEIRRFILSFNNLTTYLFLSTLFLVLLLVYFYLINPQ